MKKVDARGEDIKLGRLGLWTPVPWLCAFGTVWPIFAIGLYDSKESLQLMQYSVCSTCSVCKGVKAACAKLVKISEGVVSKVAQNFFFNFFFLVVALEKKTTQTTNSTPLPIP